MKFQTGFYQWLYLSHLGCPRWFVLFQTAFITWEIVFCIIKIVHRFQKVIYFCYLMEHIVSLNFKTFNICIDQKKIIHNFSVWVQHSFYTSWENSCWENAFLQKSLIFLFKDLIVFSLSLYPKQYLIILQIYHWFWKWRKNCCFKTSLKTRFDCWGFRLVILKTPPKRKKWRHN